MVFIATSMNTRQGFIKKFYSGTPYFPTQLTKIHFKAGYSKHCLAALVVYIIDLFLFFTDSYNSAGLAIQWHDNPIEYKHEDIQIEGYKLQSITTANDTVSYVTGGE